MPKKPRIKWVDAGQYVGLRVVSALLHCFPVESGLRTAKVLGSVMYLADVKHRKRALANLARSFPEMPDRDRRRLARRSMQQLFMLFVEVLFTPRLVHLHTWAKYCELESFEHVLGLLMRRGGAADDGTGEGRGVIMLTGHYGNWEILGYVLATLGFSTVSIARPLDNPLVNRWLLGVRERKGQKIVDKKGATTDVVATLSTDGAVGIIADQNAGTKGIFVDFFGRKASTYKSIALLAMEYRVPVVIGYARRVEDQFRFRVGAQDVIYPKDWADEDNPVRYITQRYTKAIEDFIRADPGQYLWVHRRWKTRPKGEVAEQYD